MRVQDLGPCTYSGKPGFQDTVLAGLKRGMAKANELLAGVASRATIAVAPPKAKKRKQPP